MPRIFDNAALRFLPALQEAVNHAHHLDICTGYFSLGGWKLISAPLTRWQAGQTCRLIVGMGDDKQVAANVSLAEFVGRQLVNIERLNDEDRRLLSEFLSQLRSGKVVVRLDRSGAEHSKVYLIYGSLAANPTVVFAGSSNLTYSGLSGKQNNTDNEILDQENLIGRRKWFETKWANAHDISGDLASYIEHLLNPSIGYSAPLVAASRQPGYGTGYAPNLNTFAPAPVRHQSLLRQPGVGGCVRGFLALVLITIAVALILAFMLRNALIPNVSQPNAAAAISPTASPLLTAPRSPTVARSAVPSATVTTKERMAFVRNKSAATTALRAHPSTGAAKLTDLKQEMLVEILPDAQVIADGFTWQQVRLPDGREGWVIAKVLVVIVDSH